ncbi:DUF674 family protein [Medicago truncatula]|uniref:DUF674 family protein n=1 Tax=Medicago truncatula TaxID=3880 RepID=A0A072U1A9_MEDTR|nr:DUF674 family protein [Medicago truncatula]
MASTQTEEAYVPFKLVVNEESNKVMYAEAEKNFVDVLFSFLTFPLGTIARLVQKESSMGPVNVGCLNTFYHSVADLGDECMLSETTKQMLLQPINFAEDYCNTLKLNIDDTQPTKFLVCTNFNGCYYRDMTTSTYKDKYKCRCGHSFTVQIFLKHIRQGFVTGVTTFVITDDLTIKPNCIAYTSFKTTLPQCVRRQKKSSSLKGLQRKINISFNRRRDRLRSRRLLILKNNRHRLHKQIQQGQVKKVHGQFPKIITQIPKILSQFWMHDFIEKVVEVAGDGRCGFRAVAGLRNLSLDDHQMICYQLHKEIISEGNTRYQRMINDDRRYKEVLGALTFYGIGHVPPDKLMTMSYMSFLNAQKYNHAVVLLSTQKVESETFFAYNLGQRK